VLTGGSALTVPVAGVARGGRPLRLVPGRGGGHAVADVLFGDVNPGGRLPITIYRSAADLPPFADYAMRGRTYRYFEGEPPVRLRLRPVIHDVPYTQIVPSRARSRLPRSRSRTSVRARVTRSSRSTSSRAARAAYAPHRWLAGFQRVSLKPGERRIVKIPFGPNTLAYIDQTGARRPLDGQVDIAVGGRQPDRSGHYASDTEGATYTLASRLKN
jgi:beta-glucosidase